jgi:hypothetical protein
MSWAPRSRTWKTPGPKPGGSASSPTAHQSPRRVPPSASRSYKDRPVVGPRGMVSSARFERALPTSSTSCLLPLGYEDKRAATRCRPGPSAVRRRSRSRARRRGFRGWTRTSEGRVQSPAGDASAPPGTECGRCDSNAQAARFELARSSGCLHSRMVRRQSLELRSPG